MGNLDISTGRPSKISSKFKFPQRIGTTELFWKLERRPVTSPNGSRMLAKFRMSDLSGAMKIVESSA
jgi:hypothetical protein